MKHLFQFAIVLFAALAFSSCNDEDEPTPMVWAFSDFDASQISAVYAPDYANQVQINAKPDYAGEITVWCTTFPTVTVLDWDSSNTFSNKDCGFTISRINDCTVRISFVPVAADDSDALQAFVAINGTSDSETTATTMRISRFNNCSKHITMHNPRPRRLTCHHTARCQGKGDCRTKLLRPFLFI